MCEFQCAQQAIGRRRPLHGDADALGVAQRCARRDDHLAALQALGELAAVETVGAQPEEVGLAGGRLEAEVRQRGGDPLALLGDDGDAARDDVRVAERLQGTGAVPLGSVEPGQDVCVALRTG